MFERPVPMCGHVCKQSGKVQIPMVPCPHSVKRVSILHRCAKITCIFAPCGCIAAHASELLWTIPQVDGLQQTADGLLCPALGFDASQAGPCESPLAANHYCARCPVDTTCKQGGQSTYIKVPTKANTGSHIIHSLLHARTGSLVASENGLCRKKLFLTLRNL
jgi:hypothetical protein